MGASYTIDGRLFTLQLSDTYTMDEILDTCAQAIADPAYPEQAMALMDVRASTILKERSPEDLRYMAGQLANMSSHFGSRMAIATGNQLYYGMMRMAEVFSETSGMSAKAFITLDEAIAWLHEEQGGR